MSISLEKNQKINLTKESDSLKRVRAVLSWNTPSNVFPKYDLDVSAFMLSSKAKLIADEGFIFYNNPSSPDSSVWMSEDERAGGSEELYIDIDNLSDSVAEISVIVTIHKGAERKQTFDKVSDSKIEIFNNDTGELIANFKLDKVKAGSTAVHVGTFSKIENEFTFHAIEESYELTLADFLGGYQ